jgi:hypothetical protein
MKKVSFYIIFFFISIIAYSQDITYPSKLVLNNDTIICINSKQLYKLNDTLYNYLLLKDINNLYKQRVDTLSSIIKLQNELVINKDKIIQNLDNKYWECNTYYTECKKDNEEIVKKYNRNNIKSKIVSYICILETIILTTLFLSK